MIAGWNVLLTPLVKHLGFKNTINLLHTLPKLWNTLPACVVCDGFIAELQHGSCLPYLLTWSLPFIVINEWKSKKVWERKRGSEGQECAQKILPFSSCVYSLCACDIFYRYTSELRCWAAAAHPHILALLNVFQKMSRVINMMSVLSCAFIWGCVLETVALECSQTRPASPIKNSIA